MDAVDWVRIIAVPNLDPYDIFPVLAGPDAVAHVDTCLWEGALTDEQVEKVALQALSMAADRGWWTVLKLLRSVAPHWHVLHVNNAAGMSLAGWLDEVWTKTIANMDPKHKAAWEHQITLAPKGWEEEVDFDEEEKAFLAAMNAAQ